MSWFDNALDRLCHTAAWGYHAQGESACEPAALTALALSAWNQPARAQSAAQWLADLQAEDGSVGVSASQSSPGWPTAWAILAWHAVGGFEANIARGINWLLATAGKPLERNPDMGHDTSLVGWPWVDGTHSWLEPTALSVIALRKTGHADHPRTQEAIRLLYDRLLPTGGANYGNTTVLQQMLRPHVQPSGLTLLALANIDALEDKLLATCAYLRQAVGATTTTASLTYALMGLSAFDQHPYAADDWLTLAAERTLVSDNSAYKLALLLLAANMNNGLRLPPLVLEASYAQ
jgi:hypothetical protein